MPGAHPICCFFALLIFSLHLHYFVAESSVPPAAAPASEAQPASHQLIAVARVAGPGGAPGAARPSPSNAAPRKSPHHSTYHHLTHSTTPALHFTSTAHTTHHILITTSHKQHAPNGYTIAVTKLTQTNGQSRLAGMHHNLQTLLIIGCVERNPGPPLNKKLKNLSRQH